MTKTTNTADGFTFSIPEYKPQTVIRIMQHYVDVRVRLIDRMRPTPEPLYTSSPTRTYKERPFGANLQQSWPFMERSISKGAIDGKKRALMEEELHASLVDLEEALQRITDDERDLVIKYFILQTHTLEELCAYKGLQSKGGLQERLQRIVKKLTVYMNEPKGKNT